MSTTWILVANAAKACIYTTHRGRLFQANGQDDECIQLLQSYQHRESRLKTGELVSDKVGNYSGPGPIRASSFNEPTSPKEHEAEIFAKAIAEELDKGRIHDQFDDLVIVANPHFSGILKQNLSEPLMKMVSNTIDKDYTQLKKRDLIHSLRNQI